MICSLPFERIVLWVVCCSQIPLLNSAEHWKTAFCFAFLELNVLESKKSNVPEPEMTAEGKFKCKQTIKV